MVNVVKLAVTGCITTTEYRHEVATNIPVPHYLTMVQCGTPRGFTPYPNIPVCPVAEARQISIPLDTVLFSITRARGDNPNMGHAHNWALGFSRPHYHGNTKESSGSRSCTDSILIGEVSQKKFRIITVVVASDRVSTVIPALSGFRYIVDVVLFRASTNKYKFRSILVLIVRTRDIAEWCSSP